MEWNAIVVVLVLPPQVVVEVGKVVARVESKRVTTLHVVSRTYSFRGIHNEQSSQSSERDFRPLFRPFSRPRHNIISILLFNSCI